jgi:hypothetical protein
MTNTSKFRADEWVRVRSKEEILATLDQNGQLDGLPFMPEMFQFCGQRLRVFKRAHKTCDPPSGMGGRRMLQAVHLEGIRCNGEAHGGCQAKCLIFWKDCWLEKANEDTNLRVLSGTSASPTSLPPILQPCTELDVVAGTRKWTTEPGSEEPVFVCQSTELFRATQALRSWDLRQYLEDCRSGNVQLSQLLAALFVFLYSLVVSGGVGLGTFLRWVYNTLQKLRGGTPYPFCFGEVPRGAKTPAAKLDLQAGEMVRIRSLDKILKTINEDGNNRGMSFDPEMVPYCGGTYRILDRVQKIIHERSGKMQYMKNDCIMLEGVVCRACYSKHRRFCPRSIFPYWREIWLERVAQNCGTQREIPPANSHT